MHGIVALLMIMSKVRQYLVYCMSNWEKAKEFSWLGGGGKRGIHDDSYNK